MPKLPDVTIGTATATRRPQPSVAIGQPAAESAPALLSPVVRDQTLSFAQLVENMSDPAPVLLIHELTGPESRQIALSGRALPFRGSMKFVGEMRIEDTPYVGFPKVNQTVLGAQEQETEMNGEWHDRFLLDQGEVAAVLRTATESTDPGTIALARTELRTARDLCVLFDDVRLSGRLLRVSWMHLARIGRLNIFEQDWQNPHDVKWRLKFKWVGRDDQVGLPSPPRSSLVGLAQAMGTGYADLHQATNFDDAADKFTPTVLDRIDAGVGRLQATISTLGRSVETRIAAATRATDVVRNALSLASDARDQAQDLIDQINATVYAGILISQTLQANIKKVSGVIHGRESLADFTGIDPGDQIIAACQQIGAVRAARALKHVAARQRLQALRNLEAEVVAIVRLRAQEDLRDLARQWYGTPDDWDEIRNFNGLSSSVAPAGTLIFVPALRAP